MQNVNYKAAREVIMITIEKLMEYGLTESEAEIFIQAWED